mgnify:CR=1 FL=1
MPLFGPPRVPDVPRRNARPRRYQEPRDRQSRADLMQRMGRALEKYYVGSAEEIVERLDAAPDGQFNCPAYFLQTHPDDGALQKLHSFVTVQHGVICVHRAEVKEELGTHQRMWFDNKSGTVLGTTFGAEYWARIDAGGFSIYGYSMDVTDSIDALEAGAGPTLILAAPCGAGKTTATIDYVKSQPENSRILWLTPRRSLAQQTYEMLKDVGFMHYFDLRKKLPRNLGAAEPCHLKVVCTPESLHHIPMRNGEFLNFDVVIIDEFTLVTSGLADAVTHDRTLFQHMHYLRFLLTHSRQNVLMCADFLSTDANLQLLHAWDIPCHIGVIRPPREERTLQVFLGNQALFDEMVFQDIREGRRVFVACSTRKECTRLWQLAMNLLPDEDRKFNDAVNRIRCGEPDIDEDIELVRKRAREDPPEMHLYYHRGCGARQTDDFKDVNTAWAAAAAVFTTTKASVGISCTLDGHFHRIYCYMLPCGAGVREMVQLTMRVRRPERPEVRVYVSHPSPGPIEEPKGEHVDVIPPPWRSKGLIECEREELDQQERVLGQWKHLWDIYRVEDNPLRPQYTQLRAWRAFEQEKDRFVLVSLSEVCERNRWAMQLYSLDDEVKEKEEVVDDLVANWSSFEERLYSYLNSSAESIDEAIERRGHPRRSRFQKDVGDFLLAQRPYIGTPLERLFFYAPHVFNWVNRHSSAIFRLARMLRGPIPPPLPEAVILQENSQFSESESYRKVPSACWDFHVQGIVTELGLYPLSSEPPTVSDHTLTERMGEIPTAPFPPAWTRAKTFRRNVGTILGKTIGLSLSRIRHSEDNRARWLGVETGAGRTTVFDWATALVAHGSMYIN